MAVLVAVTTSSLSTLTLSERKKAEVHQQACLQRLLQVPHFHTDSPFAFKHALWDNGVSFLPQHDGYLLFDQIPLVEMDGLKLVQTKAILSYIAGKYNLLGKDLKERAQIDMYVEGTLDLMDIILYYPFSSPEQKEKQVAAFIEKAETRYLPVYEKALKHHNQEFLVGNHLSLADIQLLEAILMLEERKADILAPFPQLQAFKARISSFPTIKKFLEPGSQRKPIADDAYAPHVIKVLQLTL